MTYPPVSESGGIRHYMLNYELYMRFTCILHPGCNFHVIKIVISAEICCNWMQLYVMVHYMHHYMKKCITWKLHEVYVYYMFYYMSLYFITKPEITSLVDYMYITSITHILQQLHVLHALYICIILFTSVVEKWLFV